MILRTGRALFKKSRLGGLSCAIARYMWDDEFQALFFVLSERCDRFSSMHQMKALRSVGLTWTWAACVDTKTSELSVGNDDALYYRPYILFESFHFFFVGFELYVEGEERNDLET